MNDTPEVQALRQSLQRSVDTLESMIANAEDWQRPPEERIGFVRYGRRHLNQVELIIAPALKTPLVGFDEARARLDLVGDELGMSRNDDKPRLKDRPEFNMGRSTVSRRRKK